MTNQELLFHGAPTLANVKLGNLFTVELTDLDDLQQKLIKMQGILQEKGVDIRLLKREKNRALIYVYRQKKLKEALENKEIQQFLQQFGYKGFTVQSSLSWLEENLKKQEFPHEIGVFLGYPLEDIQGFIENRGKNWKCSGCWKVYHNPDKATKTFEKYKKCARIYLEKYAQGFDMSRLTVAG